VKKSHARIASAWERRNNDQAGPLRRGAGSMLAFFKISHRRCRDSYPQAGQFPVDLR